MKRSLEEVNAFLKEELEDKYDFATPIPGGWAVHVESTGLRISAEAEEISGNHFVFVHLNAVVATDVPLTTDLCQWVALKSRDLILGALGLWQSSDNEAAVVIHHAFLAPLMQAEELHLTLAYLALVADEMDEAVVGVFGGRRMAD